MISMKTHCTPTAAALFALTLAWSARADLVPPPSECDQRQPGAACAMFDGTAGLCARHEDARRPGRSWSTCERDANECDRLAIGAACRGYLGRVAHCRAFDDAAKNR